MAMGPIDGKTVQLENAQQRIDRQAQYIEELEKSLRGAWERIKHLDQINGLLVQENRGLFEQNYNVGALCREKKDETSKAQFRRQ
jgi:hypothetical protein